MRRPLIATMIVFLLALAGCATTPSEQPGAAVEDRGKPFYPFAMKRAADGWRDGGARSA